jgi:hypothetical protein
MSGISADLVISQARKPIQQYTQKVAATAKFCGVGQCYSGIRGTAIQRLQRENDLVKGIRRLFDLFYKQKQFDKKPLVMGIKDLQELLSGKFNGIDIHVRKGRTLCMEPVVKQKQISGYNLFIPLAESGKHEISAHNYDFRSKLFYQMASFVKVITSPKILARFNSDKLNPVLNIRQQVFGANLLKSEFSDFNGSKKAKNIVADSIKSRIENFFKDNNCTKEEAIEILQSWRYLVMVENRAKKVANYYKLRHVYSYEKTLNDLRLNKDVKFEHSDLTSYDSTRFPDVDTKVYNFKTFIESANKSDIRKFTANYFHLNIKQSVIEELLIKKIKKARWLNSLSLDLNPASMGQSFAKPPQRINYEISIPQTAETKELIPGAEDSLVQKMDESLILTPKWILRWRNSEKYRNAIQNWHFEQRVKKQVSMEHAFAFDEIPEF